MNRLVSFIDSVVRKFWIVFCIIILIGAIFVKAMYDFGDFPYFTWNLALDVLIFIVMIGVYYLLLKCADKWSKFINYPMLWVIFGALGCLIVFFIPIKPFSDMQYVTEGALLFSKGDINGIMASDYLQVITKNLKVSMFYGILGILLPKSIFSFRIINVFLYLLIAHFLSKTGENLGLSYPKTIFIMVASYVPLLLYCNQVYFDLPVLCMCTIAVYFYTKERNVKNLMLAGIFLGIGSSLRVLSFLFVIAISVDYVFHYKKKILQDKGKKIFILLAFILISCAIPQITDALVNSCFRIEGAEDESIWTLFWMGINEEEFGFMHNEILDGTKTFSDFYSLLISRNTEQNVKLFGRKIFWEWSQGTYQAQRYAFGNDAVLWDDKFVYETPITHYFMRDEQTCRQFVNMVMRSQYLAFFVLMIIGMIKMGENERDKYRMLIYLMFGTFLVLFFYELKSRYILHCMIPMILIAIYGMERIVRRYS